MTFGELFLEQNAYAHWLRARVVCAGPKHRIIPVLMIPKHRKHLKKPLLALFQAQNTLRSKVSSVVCILHRSPGVQRHILGIVNTCIYDQGALNDHRVTNPGQLDSPVWVEGLKILSLDIFNLFPHPHHIWTCTI